MFNKILIANRGEIACRIMRTCQRMGIRSVAVYSEADSRDLHVDMADESYLIGPPLPRQSYLNSEMIIETALASGANAIHPGYGFLSENADFAKSVEEAGLTFIGPRADVIRLMGDKLQAKAIARQAGVSILPGSDVPITTEVQVKDYAAQLGYPLLLKAAGGGGGKGMRVVYAQDQIEEHLQHTTREALSSFGDGRVFVEKYMEAPRHIEIQILADTKGNIIHLGERDCSLQRRHQKVIEESPSPFLSPEVRADMVAQAIALVRQVGYTSAGTIEFMVAPNQTFYFLEMNTRLQVEHPVTEMVTGLDLVEHMIRIAAGEPLHLNQNEVIFSGHAIEARLYAEDSTDDFRPSSGRITLFDPPPLEDGLRLDSGVEAGAQISIYYDPMIAKMIACAPSRLEAIQRLKRALAQFIIEGPIHNTGFLEQLLHQPQVMQGDFTTHFIEKEMTQDLPKSQQHLIKAIAVIIHQRNTGQQAFSQWVVVVQGEGTPIKTKDKYVIVGQEKIELDIEWRPQEKRFIAKVLKGSTKETHYGQVYLRDMNLMIRLFGVDTSLQVMRPKTWDLFSHVRPPASQLDNLIVKAPIPGVLISLPISVGNQVKLGQPLLVIEAMKMENVLKSPADGVVSEIFVRAGDTLTRDQVLVKLA